MTRRHALLVLSLLLLLALSAGIASAQTPAGPPGAKVLSILGYSVVRSAAVDGQGNITLVWENLSRHRVYGRHFSAGGTLLGSGFELKRASPFLKVAANERGDTVILWDQGGYPGSPVLARLFRPGRPPLNLTVNGRGNAFSRVAGDVAIDRTGRFVAVWTEHQAGEGRLRAQRFNADGTRLGPEITLDLPGLQSSPRIAMSHATGDFVLLWVSSVRDLPNRILGQRFGFTTGPQGDVFQASSRDTGTATPNFVAKGADDGSFAVVWTRYKPSAEPPDILVEHFDADGERSGGEILEGPTARPAGDARLAMAPEGHFVVIWDVVDGAEPFRSRLYHADGTPAGPSREIPGTAHSTGPQPAFGWDGTFVLTWNDPSTRLLLQSFAASPGAEPCVFRQGHFLCNTDAAPGVSVDHLFAVRSGTPVLGDVDGDGRDDYCLFRGTRFDCDSGHDYGAAEFTAVFGQPGDTPLIGDLNGDGRDEVCVFRAGTFLCDSARDGGAAETVLTFGQAGDKAVVGDLNGDGRDDACVLRADQFLCDTAGNGGTAETVLTAVATPGIVGALRVPLLGDVDGDGREDPCIALSRVLPTAFYCDTAHDGGGAEAVLYVQEQATPLLGNVDGL